MIERKLHWNHQLQKKKVVLLVCLLYVALEMKIKIKEVG